MYIALHKCQAVFNTCKHYSWNPLNIYIYMVEATSILIFQMWKLKNREELAQALTVSDPKAEIGSEGWGGRPQW